MLWNDNGTTIDNTSSIISNIACNTIPNDIVPTNANDKMDMSNVNDNMGKLNNDNDGSITWDDIVTMEDAAKEPLWSASTIVYPTSPD